MAVEKLFWDDPYLTRCDAIVTLVDGERVTLDRTVAFAFSGGQSSDAGAIAGHQIFAAETSDPEIVYTLPADHGLSAGDTVEVVIDWPRRYRLMRLHFAAELVLEIITRDYGAPEKTGAHIGEDKARLDFRWEGSIASALPAVLAEVDSIVAADLPIESAFSDEISQRRYWRIEGFAQVSCGGTHPRSTGEVGAITLKRQNPGGGVERIEIRLVEGGPTA
ncbi:MAG: alanyl-tRNA editing protein [Coriobacteriia bacterium]